MPCGAVISLFAVTAYGVAAVALTIWSYLP